MKKILSILMSIVFALNFFAISISAAEQPDVSKSYISEILQKGKITEINENAITIEYDRVVNNSLSPFSFNNSKTRQKDCCTIILDGTVEAENMIERLASTTNSETDSYDGAAATLYSTINYNTIRSGANEYIQLISASGYVVRYNSLTTVVQNEVIMGTCGIGMDGLSVQVDESYYFPNVYSWFLNAPAECVPVEKSFVNDWTAVGCKYICTLKRGTATIRYTLTNNAF